MQTTAEKTISSSRLCRTEIILTLISALEYRERLTAGHSEKVTLYAMMIADRLGIKGKDRETLRQAALLHDIGKIGIPTEILCKKGPLTPTEMKVMRKHPLIAKNIISPIEGLAGVVPSVLHHHERFDGRGYPDGLRGEAIPLGARVIAVADAFETMTNARLYRRKMPVRQALRRLEEAKGTQFDPAVVDAFLDALAARLSEH